MKPEDIAFLTDLLKKESGLVINASKAYLLENRLQPLVRRDGLQDVEELVQKLRGQGDKAVIKQVVEAMTTNESFFFRDQRPFDLFRDTILPAILAERSPSHTLRIWCAAAATGQEPYSLAMILKEKEAELGGRAVEIVATDLDTEVLARAKAGLYSQFEVQRGLPVQMLVKYFEKSGEKWQISPVIQKMVDYRAHNLLKTARALGIFDVVFCRNVLIYFDAETKKVVLDDIAGLVPEDGVIFLGGAETVLGVTDSLAPMPGLRGVYCRPQAAEAAKLKAAEAAKIEATAATG